MQVVKRCGVHCRLRCYTQEMCVFREDVLELLGRNTVCAQSDEETVTVEFA